MKNLERQRIPYSRFAYAYDDMMSHVDYTRWVNYVVDLFDLYGAKPRRILDLACGTGSVAIPLAKRGYEIVGIDRAAEMLEVADAKAQRAGVSVRWAQGDMRSFVLDEPVDAVLCLYDSINYMLSLAELRQVFECVARALEPGGLFIFDVISERNILQHFHLQTFAENHPNYSFTWKNVYSKYDKICRTELTFFYRKEGDLFERAIETHLQKIFEIKEIRDLLRETGYEFLSALEAWTLTKAGRTSDRINITARKRASSRLRRAERSQ